jgi:hypothetical protein
MSKKSQPVGDRYMTMTLSELAEIKYNFQTEAENLGGWWWIKDPPLFSSREFIRRASLRFCKTLSHIGLNKFFGIEFGFKRFRKVLLCSVASMRTLKEWAV